MPELPEVQTVVNSISKKINNSTINQSHIIDKKVIYNFDSLKFSSTFKFQKIINTSRIGKYIIIHLKNNYLVFVILILL